MKTYATIDAAEREYQQATEAYAEATAKARATLGRSIESIRKDAGLSREAAGLLLGVQGRSTIFVAEREPGKFRVDYLVELARVLAEAVKRLDQFRADVPVLKRRPGRVRKMQPII